MLQDMEIKIKRLTEIDSEVVDAFNSLMAQLTEGNRLLTADGLREIVNAPNVYVFIAEEDGCIVGTITLVTYTTPSGIKSWIEDVVVDDSQRGKGVGRRLVEASIRLAESLGITKTDLTSNPLRVSANKLYQRAGFRRRNTNVYRYEP
jgi:GNAT superfamily N-acetyltransferase